MANAWLFLPSDDLHRTAKIVRSLQLRDFPISLAIEDCIRNWHKQIPGTAFAIDGCHNEYGGILAFDHVGGRFGLARSISLAEAIKQLHEKHPSWSDTKLQRAAEEQVQARSQSSARGGAEHRAHATVKAIQKLTEAFGSVSLAVCDEPFDGKFVSIVKVKSDSITTDTLLSLKVGELLVVS